MKGRSPTKADVELMKKAVAYVTSYHHGTEVSEFNDFMRLVSNESNPMGMLHSLTQLAWCFLSTMESAGIDPDDVLEFYGIKFAERAERM